MKFFKEQDELLRRAHQTPAKANKWNKLAKDVNPALDELELRNRSVAKRDLKQEKTSKQEKAHEWDLVSIAAVIFALLVLGLLIWRTLQPKEDL